MNEVRVERARYGEQYRMQKRAKRTVFKTCGSGCSLFHRWRMAKRAFAYHDQVSLMVMVFAKHKCRGSSTGLPMRRTSRSSSSRDGLTYLPLRHGRVVLGASHARGGCARRTDKSYGVGDAGGEGTCFPKAKS